LRRYRLFLVVALAVMATLSACTMIPAAPQLTPSVPSTMPQGTKVEDLDLSGFSREQARQRLQIWAEDKLAQTITLVYNGTKIPMALRELGVALDLPRIWAEIARNPGTDVAGFLQVDRVRANQVLHDRLSRYDQAAKDATYRIEGDKFIVQEGVPGQTAAPDGIIRAIHGTSLSALPGEIEVQTAEVPPTVTTEAVRALGFDGVIGEFSTQFSFRDENRSANLAAAAKALDKKLIKPGEVFSFNDTVGPRTTETGYRDAYIIINNEYVPGIGGGVCQVSSTLYNAALYAGLPIVQRSPHQVAVAYVPLGQDATVNYPNLDLKFKNDTGSLIYVRTQVKPGLLTIRLFGKKSGKTVRLVHETEKEIGFATEIRPDANLPPGRTVQDQAGTKGFVVKTWRIVKDAQGNETEQFLSRDVYAPANRILRVGIRGAQ